jgi:hypothetical protein
MRLDCDLRLDRLAATSDGGGYGVYGQDEHHYDDVTLLAC